MVQIIPDNHADVLDFWFWHRSSMQMKIKAIEEVADSSWGNCSLELWTALSARVPSGAIIRFQRM